VTMGNLTLHNPAAPDPPTVLTLADTAYHFRDVTADDGTAIHGELEISGKVTLAGEAPLWSATADVNPTIRLGLLDQHIGTVTFVGNPQMVVEDDGQGNILSKPSTTFEIISDQHDKIVVAGTPTVDSEMVLDGDVTIRGIGVLWNGSVPQGHTTSIDPGNEPPEPLTLTLVEAQDAPINLFYGMFDAPEAFPAADWSPAGGGLHVGKGIFNRDAHNVQDKTFPYFDANDPGKLLWVELGKTHWDDQPLPEEKWGLRYYPAAQQEVIDPTFADWRFLPKVTDSNGLTYHLVDDALSYYVDPADDLLKPYFLPPGEGGVLDAENFAKTTGDFFVALSGDNNGDGAVNGSDVAAMIVNWTGNLWKPAPNKTWLEGDVTGGPSDRGDGQVNLLDFMVLLQNYNKADPGVAEGSATAVYDPATGEFTVSVEGVMAWALWGDGQLTGKDIQGVSAALPCGEDSLVSANGDAVGEGSLVGLLSYDVELGQLVEPGTEPSQIHFEYMLGFGGPRHSGTITVVPEPGTAAMLLAVLVAGVLWLRRRRKP